MRRRQITIEDGRYLIFYSFEDEPGLDASSPATRDEARHAEGAGDGEGSPEAGREPAVEPSPEDERGV
jgi:hypothetical protein